MLDREATISRVKDAVSGLLSDTQTELIELIFRPEGGRLVLRFIVDRPGGITVDDCAQLNSAISGVLDQADLIQQRYVLEVASPGLDRPLKTKRDFERAMEKKVMFHLRTPVAGKVTYAGIVEKVEDDRVYIRTKDAAGVEIAFETIAKAQEEIGF